MDVHLTISRSSELMSCLRYNRSDKVAGLAPITFQHLAHRRHKNDNVDNGMLVPGFPTGRATDARAHARSHTDH